MGLFAPCGERHVTDRDDDLNPDVARRAVTHRATFDYSPIQLYLRNDLAFTTLESYRRLNFDINCFTINEHVGRANASIHIQTAYLKRNGAP